VLDACDDALRIIRAAQDCRTSPSADQEEKLTALQNNMAKLKGALNSLIQCMKQPTMEQTDILKSGMLLLLLLFFFFEVFLILHFRLLCFFSFVFPSLPHSHRHRQGETETVRVWRS
jgi:hypothetical protein